MTRAKISQYSATANDNTDVNGVNIAEGCPPSSMNNMGREIMAALKRFQVGSDGDGVTVGGSLVVSGSTSVNTFNVDVISEKTSAAGVTVDGVLLKDSGVVTGAGTVSAPVYSTTGDTNTGIFFPAADTIAFAEGGAEAMRINSSSQVLVGTTTARSDFSGQTAVLQVEGTSVGTSSVAITRNENNAFGPILYLSKSRGGLDGHTIVQSGDTIGEIIFQGADGVDDSGALVRAATIEVAVDGTPGSNDMPGRLMFYTTADGSTSPTERMRIDSSGNVGIGTSSPAAKLHIVTSSGGSTTGLVVQKSAQNFFQFYADTNNTDGVIACAGAIRFENGSGTERARITSSGDLLVGMTAATGESTASVRAGLIAGQRTAVGDQVFQAWNKATSGNNLFQVFATETAQTTRGTIDYNRTGGAVRYNTTSDATLKNIIGDSNGQRSVEILNTTRIREFAWKDDETQKPQIGVIAQELHETYKGAVSVGGDIEVTIPAVTEQRLVSEAILDEDGNEIEAAVYETVEVEPERTETQYRPWGVDKTAFTFHLVAGWQAHEKIIKQQADMIAALEARIAALEQA